RRAGRPARDRAGARPADHRLAHRPRRIRERQGPRPGLRDRREHPRRDRTSSRSVRRLVDARLAVPAATAWVAAAVVQTWSPWHAAVLAAGSVLAGVVGYAASGRGRTAMVVAATCLGVAGCAAAMGMHVAALHRGPVASLARSEQTVELGMRLVRDPVEVHSHSGRRLV